MGGYRLLVQLLKHRCLFEGLLQGGAVILTMTLRIVVGKLAFRTVLFRCKPGKVLETSG
jgi:hypothetical protein